MRQARIYVGDAFAGILSQEDIGYRFVYDTHYLNSPASKPVSLTFPLKATPFVSKVLFPFFDGLIPEGWLLDIASKNWKLNRNDRMGLLLACCRNCIGAVSIEPITDSHD